MCRKVFFYTVINLIFVFFCGIARAEDKAVYKLEPVVVRSSLLETYARDPLKSVSRIYPSQSAEAQSFSGVLEQLSSVDLQRRGVFDIQPDLQIRAATFEQTDVLIDGIKVNDPQTGHFSMDVPLFISDVDKIVVVSGAASSLAGAGRQGGSVHFITKRPEGERLYLDSTFGEHTYFDQTISADYRINKLNLRTSLGQANSGGYRYNTDFDIVRVSQLCDYKGDSADAEFSFFFMDKEFGANGFYSEFYPDQKEHTKTALASLGIKTKDPEIFFNPKLYVRRHWDHYLLDKNNPAFYENYHTTYVKGGKLDCGCEIFQGTLFWGMDIARESIESSSLGDHSRSRNTFNLAFRSEIDELFFNLGTTAYFYDDFRKHAVPDLSAGYWLGDNLKLRSAYSRSFRAPTFTELYYRSPANNGNENLSVETADNYEIGADYTREYIASSLTVFMRKEKNLIDWVRDSSATVYQAENISRTTAKGLETNVKIYPEKIFAALQCLQEVSFSYCYLDRDKKENNLISKYVFDYLKHKFVLGAKNSLPGDLKLDSSLLYLQKTNGSGDFIFNTALSRGFSGVEIFVRADNLFNHPYEEKSGIPMPGRWLFCGIKAEW